MKTHWASKPKLRHPSPPRRARVLCKVCLGMSWHRPRERKCKCGERYAPEQIKRTPATVPSSAVEWGNASE